MARVPPKKRPAAQVRPDTVNIRPTMQQVAERYNGPSALNSQVGGQHYKDMPIQPVEFIHANDIPFIEGSIIKYVCRHRSKNGREDLKKAAHFLQMLIEMEYDKPFIDALEKTPDDAS